MDRPIKQDARSPPNYVEGAKILRQYKSVKTQPRLIYTLTLGQQKPMHASRLEQK